MIREQHPIRRALELIEHMFNVFSKLPLLVADKVLSFNCMNVRREAGDLSFVIENGAPSTVRIYYDGSLI